MYVSITCRPVPDLTECTASSGLGVVGGDTANLVGLGGCKPECERHRLFNMCDRR